MSGRWNLFVIVVREFSVGTSDQDGGFGSEDCVFELLGAFAQQAALLRPLIEMVLSHQSASSGSLAPILMSIEDSSRTLVLLGRHHRIRDFMVTARTCLLTILNACFMCASPSAANRAIQHYLQKSYRDLRRETKSRTIRLVTAYSGKHQTPPPEIQAALKEFSTKKDREITQWTPEGVQKQLETIEDMLGHELTVPLVFAVQGIYRHASEIAHGTLFGFMWTVGRTVPRTPTSKESLSKYQGQVMSEVLMSLNWSISSTIKATLKSLAIQAEEIVSKSAGAVREMVDVYRRYKPRKTGSRAG